jgi:hypothetical protein
MTALKLRDAALSLLRCSGAPSCQRGALSIVKTLEPESDGRADRVMLLVTFEGKQVFDAWWLSDDPDDIAAVVNHGDWESKLMEAAHHAR